MIIITDGMYSRRNYLNLKSRQLRLSSLIKHRRYIPMKETIRLSIQGLRILAAFSDLSAKHCGAELMGITGMSPGTLYPLLFRLESAGWLKCDPEEGNPSELGRPLKRFYQLTSRGLRKRAEARTDNKLMGNWRWLVNFLPT